MKLFIALSILATLSISAGDCNKQKKQTMLKGRIEISEICLSYTIKLVEGYVDTSMIASSWTDENTGKIYENVFGLSNPCTFPSNLKKGDEFYFKIDTTPTAPCMKCEAWYPTPPRSLNIKVVEK